MINRRDVVVVLQKVEGCCTMPDYMNRGNQRTVTILPKMFTTAHSTCFADKFDNDAPSAFALAFSARSGFHGTSIEETVRQWTQMIASTLK